MTERILYIQLNLYGFLICLIMLINQWKIKIDVLGKRTFTLMTISMMVVEVLNILSWLLRDNSFKHSQILYLTVITIQFAIQIVPCILLYAYSMETSNKYINGKNIKKYIVITVIILWLILTIYNLYKPYIFYIDNNNYYRMKAFYIVIAVLGVIILCTLTLCIYQYIKLKKKAFFHIIVVIGISSIGAILQIVTYRLEISGLAIILALLYLSIFIQGKRTNHLIYELIEAENTALLSQMQPHFIYNSIITIENYCETDSKTAKDGINQFSSFLRGNLDSIMSKNPVYFKDEMKYVKAYLYLEKLRKQDNLNVIYDLEVEDFFLPALTIQPVIENAIKYGISSREDGGTVKIITRNENHKIKITIEDDGVGMDVDRIEDIPVKNDGRAHVGLINVKTRLKNMVNGDMDIHSNKQYGTTIIITIPIAT